MSKTTSFTLRIDAGDRQRFVRLSKDVGIKQGALFGRLLDIGEEQIRKSLPPRKPLKATGS